MKRDLARLASERFDLVILGGGVYGLAAAREAALRGLSVAVLERGDFGQFTSAASLKLVHGGLRYLQHLNLRRMRISIRERSRFLRLAPHLVRPLEFLIPCFGHAMKGPEVLQAALWANDLMAWDRNRGLGPSRRIPAGRRVSRAECLERLPALEGRAITGAVSFHDAQMHNSERLTLAFGLAAAENGAALANRVEARGFRLRSGRILAVRAADRESGEPLEVAGDFFLNMTGPWGEQTAARLRAETPPRRVLRSKGIQLVTRSIGAVAFPIESRQRDVTARIRRGGRNYFVTPWRGHSLIGTTDTLFEGDPDDFAVTERDIAEFVDELRDLHPAAGLRRADVRFWIGGLRPLGDEDTRPDIARASHRMQTVDHRARDGVENLFSVTGVKYTVAAHVAETTLTRIVRRLGRGAPPGAGRRTPLPGGNIGDWPAFLGGVVRDSGFPEPVARSLAAGQGTRWTRIRDMAGENPEWGRPVDGSGEVLRAEIVHAVREEMALRLTDAVLRRTGLGTLGHPGRAALEDCARLMAAELGWSADRTRRELDEAEAVYRL